MYMRKTPFLCLGGLLLLSAPAAAQPVVTTHPFVARGTTLALGRMSVTLNGTTLKERGFCWSTAHQPTLSDSHSTLSYANNGPLYRMEGLTPATVYYVRAYAMTTDSVVSYGDEVKVITLPQGNTQWTYDYGGPTEANQRTESALIAATDIYNRCTSIRGFTIAGHYDADTQTASCMYGGYMRMGPGEQYQCTGTVLHEMAHGVGVGTISTWNNNAILRQNTTGGYWLGERANAVVQFLSNSTSTRLNGDSQHMWPFGNNYATEWSANPEFFYIANALVVQALGEDGLPPTSSYHIANPAYTFPSEDGVKYYLKSESTERGMETDFLRESSTGRIVRQTMTAAEAAANDSAAWYVTFDPQTCLYRLQNVATGRYVTHTTTAFRLVDLDEPTDAENLQLLGSRSDITVGSGDTQVTAKGYWITFFGTVAKALAPQLTGYVAAADFDFSDSAALQRILLLTADEAAALDRAVEQASGIGHVTTPASTARIVAIYNLSGQQIHSLQRGVNLVRRSDGTVQKVLCK